jgi:hypothetical protein
MRIPENRPAGVPPSFGTPLRRQGELTGVQPVAGSSAVPVEAAKDRPPSDTAIRQVFKSYFYWTFPRGSFQYDVMVTLILAFIFITPQLWNYGDKPTSTGANTRPVLVTGDGANGLIVVVEASAVDVPAASSNAVIKKALKKAMEPVLGDSISVTRWELTRDANGNPVTWKVWAHR